MYTPTESKLDYRYYAVSYVGLKQGVGTTKPGLSRPPGLWRKDAKFNGQSPGGGTLRASFLGVVASPGRKCSRGPRVQNWKVRDQTRWL
jgi:hypothetical protein